MDWSVLPGRSLNDTPYHLSSSPLSELDPKELDVKTRISFHLGNG